ncbi:peptide deformylase [Taylorella equigenitalis]|uniref:peptide deformylase n=1 Tax=Taylorella equigenitalis TaxID=29575 RepID=UPI000429B689|nr:peptide deformylase [Taylorella equigenitalis]ASY41372.1 peptide deformylase [Taylorella equigenitalis]WDU51754.1 peptide deformylase [Taylorella equigenitalis]
MAVLPILKYPDPRLKKIAKDVDVVDESIKKIVEDMAETMYAANGVGLAATQVDIHKRIVVIDVSEERNDLIVLINPEIIGISEEKVIHEEGCLSVPTIYDNVERFSEVRVKALDQNGNAFEFKADGLLAICVQHELDHLMGKVFVEKLSALKQNRIKTKLKKAQKEEKN